MTVSPLAYYLLNWREMTSAENSPRVRVLICSAAEENSFFFWHFVSLFPVITIYRRDDTRQIESGYPDLIPLSEAVTISVWRAQRRSADSPVCTLSPPSLVYIKCVAYLTCCYHRIRWSFFKYSESCCRFRRRYFHVGALNISKTDWVCFCRELVSGWKGAKRSPKRRLLWE